MMMVMMNMMATGRDEDKRESVCACVRVCEHVHQQLCLFGSR